MTQPKKSRATIPKDIAADSLYSSDRTCCVCNEPGKPIQIHHIDENPAHNSIENLAVLCLLCHEQTQISGGFGRKLDCHQVVRYRDAWLDRVSKRRDQADQQAIQFLNKIHHEGSTPRLPIPLNDYVALLPSLLERAYQNAQQGWGSGVTSEMLNASYEAIAALEGMLTYLAGFYPKGHFDERNPRNYISEIISSRFIWHKHVAEPGGGGTGGTMIGPLVSARVIHDIELMVENLVLALSGEFNECFEKSLDWKANWDRASICFKAGGERNDAKLLHAPGETSPIYEKPSYWVISEDKKDGPFCQRCYDTDQKLIRLQGGSNDKWLCHACKSYFYGPNHQPPQRKVISNGWKAWT